MKPVILFLLAAAFAAAVLVPAKAQSASSTTPEASALWELFRARTSNDPKWRASLADALHRYCESVLVQVPRNTPQEDQWVDSEFQALNATFPPPSLNSAEWNERRVRHDKRFLRVMSSVENARAKTSEAFLLVAQRLQGN
jgi:hypothetical protein